MGALPDPFSSGMIASPVPGLASTREAAAQAFDPNCDIPLGSPEQPDVPRVPGSHKVRLVYPPWIEPFPRSLNFDATDFNVTIPAVPGIVVPVASFTPPDGNVGWLQNLTQYILTPVAGVRLIWSVTIANGPVSGFDKLRNPPMQSRALVLTLNDMRVRIGQGAKVQLNITNESGVGCIAGGSISGWHHTRIDEIAQWGDTL